jgi:hypothetical protein
MLGLRVGRGAGSHAGISCCDRLRLVLRPRCAQIIAWVDAASSCHCSAHAALARPAVCAVHSAAHWAVHGMAVQHMGAATIAQPLQRLGRKLTAISRLQWHAACTQQQQAGWACGQCWGPLPVTLPEPAPPCMLRWRSCRCGASIELSAPACRRQHEMSSNVAFAAALMGMHAVQQAHQGPCWGCGPAASGAVTTRARCALQPVCGLVK